MSYKTHAKLIYSGITHNVKQTRTRSNRLGHDPDSTDHLKYRPVPIQVPGPLDQGSRHTSAGGVITLGAGVSHGGNPSKLSEDNAYNLHLNFQLPTDIQMQQEDTSLKECFARAAEEGGELFDGKTWTYVLTKGILYCQIGPQKQLVVPQDLRQPVPIWSSGQDSWFSPRRPGFDSRYGKVGSSLLPSSNGPHVFLRRKPFLASSRAAES
ncbi:hypothetical protein QQF64_003473 [Cirrhinus molitorella]|uniref:Uncharacterized protein n=1 Tax=Cirrhinus molitorella TaxID=172907 RepID=A0ABR3MLE9_9TELE